MHSGSLVNVWMCTPTHTHTHTYARACARLEKVYVHDSPARPRCSVWCKLCMCKKHSIIRPSIIRGCQWALSGWYITLSCPLPQLGPAQPARHAGNAAGQTYSTGRDIGWERRTVWHAFPMITMPHCKCQAKNCDECVWEGSVLRARFELNWHYQYSLLWSVGIKICQIKQIMFILNWSLSRLKPGPVLHSCISSVRHDLHMSACRHLIYHGDDLCNNPGVMKLVT